MIKYYLLVALCCGGFATVSFGQSEAKIEKVDDGFRFLIDGELFTQWQSKAWAAGYLFPVIGPTGHQVTRNFPMIPDVEGEQTDHPHHRSIRFSHRKVNGFSFWSPDPKKAGHDCSIEFAKVETMKDGELIIHNDWKGEGKLILRERLRLNVTPLEKNQVLLDYDTELTALNEDVIFSDQKDGGLAVRVAPWMVVAHHKTKQGNGTIINSLGDKNTAAWGKQAPWASYYGPDPDGNVVGIAIFDHPNNLRYPAHWHARTYGLLTVNRFGKGAYEKNKGAAQDAGDYTIKKGDTLKLRHRIYIYQGDPETAKVAEQFATYAKPE